jgi:hypothetical protein
MRIVAIRMPPKNTRQRAWSRSPLLVRSSPLLALGAPDDQISSSSSALFRSSQHNSFGTERTQDPLREKPDFVKRIKMVATFKTDAAKIFRFRFYRI